MANTVKIVSINKITHDVLRIRTVKPPGISFIPGQAADISINKSGWENEIRPFTFTSLPENDFLEFTIKTYPDRNGMTNQLLSLTTGDEIIIGDVFGDIQYKGEGVFIAGGAGITPFISIFRALQRNNTTGTNTLIFANKTSADIIDRAFFESSLGDRFINVLSDEVSDKFLTGHVDAQIIKRYQMPNHLFFYVCGPPPMMDAILQQLKQMNVDEQHIITEAF